jgi:hypothetical protein
MSPINQDILIELLDACGFFYNNKTTNTNNEEPEQYPTKTITTTREDYQHNDKLVLCNQLRRMQVIASVQQLYDMARFQQQEQEQEQYNEEDNLFDRTTTTDTTIRTRDDLFLIELEHILSLVRTKCELFLSSINDERLEVLSICKNSLTTTNTTKTTKTTKTKSVNNSSFYNNTMNGSNVIMNSLKTNYQLQSQLEELSVHKLRKKLDTFYHCISNNRINDELLPFLIDCIICLERRSFFNQYDHKLLVSVLMESDNNDLDSKEEEEQQQQQNQPQNQPQGSATTTDGKIEKDHSSFINTTIPSINMYSCRYQTCKYSIKPIHYMHFMFLKNRSLLQIWTLVLLPVLQILAVVRQQR